MPVLLAKTTHQPPGKKQDATMRSKTTTATPRETTTDTLDL